MKKITVIVAAILRGAILLAPGVAFLWWLWGKVASFVAILAALGLESIWALVFSFVVLTVQAWRNQRKKMESAEELTEEP